MSAINKLSFPKDRAIFHREQAWERWVKDRTEIQAATLLDLLRDCVNAPVNCTVEMSQQRIYSNKL